MHEVRRAIVEVLESRRLLTTFYVSPTGSDSHSGLSPAQAVADIQQAVNDAKALAIAPLSQDNNTILVATGTYVYRDSLATDSKSLGYPAIVGVIDQQLTITGGYDASFTTANGASIIDGGGTTRGVSVISSIRHTGISLSNFTIQNCLGGVNTTGSSLTGIAGGMIIDMGADQAQNPTDTLTNVTFSGNTVQGATSSSSGVNGGAGGEATGGGLAAFFARSVVLQNVTFTGNFARGGTGPTRGGAGLGAGLYEEDGSHFSGSSVTFTNNQSIGANSTGTGVTSGNITADGFGGGLALLTGCTATFASVIATGNQALGGNAGSATNSMAGSGYGGAFYGEESSISLTDANINNNTADGGSGWHGGTPAGGGIFLYEGGTNSGTLALDRVAVVNNSETSGSGSTMPGGALGGGVAVQNQGTGTLTANWVNVLIAGNQLTSPGGGAVAGNSGGGGLWDDGATVNVEHATIADNAVQSNMAGQAILLYAGNVNIAFSIIANQNSSTAAAISPVSSGTVTLTGKTLFANNSGNGTFADSSGFTATAGSAGFVDAANRNYNLQSGSAAVHQASGSAVATDIAFDARFGVPDLGAYQFGTPPAPGSLVDKLGAYRASDGAWSLDANGNRVFDGADHVYFNFSGAGRVGVSGSWSNSGRDQIGDFANGVWHLDLNGDGSYQANDDRTFTFGRAGDVPVVGNFYGTGTRVGVFRTAPDGVSGEFIIDRNNDGIMDAGDDTFVFGAAGDRVVIGDWNGNGTDKVGVFRSTHDVANTAVFTLDTNGNHAYDAGVDQVFNFGLFSDGIVIGDWNGAGTDEVGVYRPATGFGAPATAVFSLDDNNNHAYDSGVDEVFLFGNASDQFAVGNWS